MSLRPLIGILLLTVLSSPASADEFEALVRNLAAVSPTPVNRGQDTQLFLDQQERGALTGQNPLNNQNSLQEGRDRASQMADMLKSEEMQKALQQVTTKGKDALQRDPSLRTPVGVIAGAVSLWVGKSVKLFTRDSVTLTTRIEARARSSEFTMESPFLNGKFSFTQDDGFSIYMNRTISSIKSQAEFNYNLKNQVFSTSIRHHLFPNLDLSFGAAQIPQTTTTDGNARIEYRFNF